MNEFTAKKLGEVLAFAMIGLETVEKGQTAFVSVLGEDMVENILSETEMHRDTLLAIAKENGIEDVVSKKKGATGEKLRSMRDLYIGEQWDNPTELLEWSGFFEGAALVHWSIIRGVGETIGNEKVTELANSAWKLHHEILETASKLLLEVGKKKSA